jgi:hypothetical protein
LVIIIIRGATFIISSLCEPDRANLIARACVVRVAAAGWRARRRVAAATSTANDVLRLARRHAHPVPQVSSIPNAALMPRVSSIRISVKQATKRFRTFDRALALRCTVARLNNRPITVDVESPAGGWTKITGRIRSIRPLKNRPAKPRWEITIALPAAVPP